MQNFKHQNLRIKLAYLESYSILELKMKQLSKDTPLVYFYILTDILLDMKITFYIHFVYGT